MGCASSTPKGTTVDKRSVHKELGGSSVGNFSASPELTEPKRRAAPAPQEPPRHASPPPSNAKLALEIDCSGLPNGEDGDDFDLASDDEGDDAPDGEYVHALSSDGGRAISTSQLTSRCSSFFNPYDEVESKTPNRSNGGNGDRILRQDSVASSRGDDEPEISLSNLSTLTPRPPQDIAALRRTYEGGCYTLPTKDRPDLPAARIPTVQERIAARTQELDAFFSNSDGSTKYSTSQSDPTVVQGKGLLLPHVGYYNEPMPAVVFKKTVPKHRAWFLESIAQVSDLLEDRKFTRALRYMDQIELQATAQRLSYMNGLAKVFAAKLRDLVLLEQDKRNFLRLLRESGDIEGYQELFRREIGVEYCRSSNNTSTNSLSGTLRGPDANNSAKLSHILPYPILAPADSKYPLRPGGVSGSLSPVGAHHPNRINGSPTEDEASQMASPWSTANNTPSVVHLHHCLVTTVAPPGEVPSDDELTSAGMGSGSSIHALKQVQLTDFIKQQLGIEVRYTLLCMECFIVNSLNKESRDSVWAPPARFIY